MILRYVMKWVADHIRLAPLQMLAMVLLFCSCGSSQKAQHSTEVAKVEISSSSVGSSSVVKQNLIAEMDNSTEELHITITEYDTALPVDSLTKKSPVKKEIKVSRSKGSKKQSEQKENNDILNVSKKEGLVQKQDSISAKVVKIRQETSVPRQIGNATKWICVLIALLIVWYLIRRYGRR